MPEQANKWISAAHGLPKLGSAVEMKFDDMGDELAWYGDIMEELADLKPECHYKLLWRNPQGLTEVDINKLEELRNKRREILN